MPPSLTGLAIGAGRGVRNKVSPPKAHKLPATQSPEDQAQQQWWAQQHQWYGAQYQWWATNQHDSADAAAPVTTSASGPSSPLPAPPADAPPSAPRVHDVLREAPPMHPYVASAVGAMPQQIQQASSLPPVDMSFCGAPLARGGRCSNRAGSCPHHSAGGGSLPPLPPTPTRAPRSTPVYSAPSPADSARTMSLPSAPAPQPAPAAAVPAPPRSRVADLINTPR